MFGFDFKPIADGRTLQLARPEKALLDLLYLYPFYNTAQELDDLRLDEDFLHDDLDLVFNSHLLMLNRCQIP